MSFQLVIESLARKLQRLEYALKIAVMVAERRADAENDSGGQTSDVTFTGSGIGIEGGNQQFKAQRLMFNGCTTGIQVIWDWG